MITRLHNFLTSTAAVCPNDIALVDHRDTTLTWLELVDAV